MRRSCLESYACLVRSCGSSKDLRDARRAHDLVTASEHKKNIFLANHLIQMYGKCGSPDDARRVFDSIVPGPNPFSWGILLQSYLRNHRLADAKLVFDAMPVRNIVTWSAVLTANAQNGHSAKAELVFDRMPEWDVASMNAIVSGLIKSAMIDQARKRFDAIPERNPVSWIVILTGYAQAGNFLESKWLFDRMLLEIECPSDPALWNPMIIAHAQAGDLASSRQAFETMPRRDAISWNTIINAFAQHGDAVQSQALFDRMPQHDVLSHTAILRATATQHPNRGKSAFDAMPRKNLVTWTVILAAYCDHGRLDSARKIFDLMPERDTVPWNAMIVAYARTGHIDRAKLLFDNVHDPSTAIWNCMIGAYGQNGQIQEARALFDRCSRQNIVTWNALLVSYAQCLRGAVSIHLFQRLNLEGFSPDELSFMGILIACCHLGLVQGAREIFVSMELDFDLRPERDHYCCVIGVLGGAGLLDDAEELVETMPFVPDASNWGCLISACKIHCPGMERSVALARNAIAMDFSSAAPFVDFAGIFTADHGNNRAFSDSFWRVLVQRS